MQISKDNKTALVFGASGLVGSHLTNFLLLHPAYGKVVVFVRKPLETEHPKLVQQAVNFDQPLDFQQLVKGDDLFCCLGTTMAKAGSKEAFFKVDFTYAHEAAVMGARNGVHQFLLVSSVGADPDSLFFYSKVKGQLEAAVQQLNFWSTHIFRPSVLLGERNENRWGEDVAGKMARVIDRFTGGLLSKYRPIEADVVAKAMVSAAQGLRPGGHFYPSHWLQGIAAEIDKIS
ncbi:MAG: NAD(P)H-binding protein [Bacteroidetes bacterium]|nr:NAD(P)H-binding protein [Bacteroidota bacterium]